MKTDFNPSDTKFKELILYISKKCQHDARYGSVKLNKILFYSDFIAFGELQHPITGQEYQKLEHGPAPRRLLPIKEQMEQSGEIAIQKTDVFGKTQHRWIALRDADLSEFNGAEIAIVDEVIDQLGGANARQISDLSHTFPGWSVANMGETIPYQMVFLSDRELSEFEKDYALDITPSAKD